MNKTFGRVAAQASLVLAFAVSGCAMHNTSVGTKIDDTAITTKVKAALLADPGVSGQKVSVDTVAGVVQLSGFVADSAAMSRAADIARRTEGVVQVQNKISVQP